MKRPFFILSTLLVSACSHLQPPLIADMSALPLFATEPSQDSCESFPYDNSNSACNLFGWQEFVFQSLSQTKQEHDAALLALGNSREDKYKRLILLSENYESLDVRRHAKNAMLVVSAENGNGFGHFFYILANLQEQRLLNEDNVNRLQAKLDSLLKKNNQLAAELADTQAKIQAIMDIEKNLNTN